MISENIAYGFAWASLADPKRHISLSHLKKIVENIREYFFNQIFMRKFINLTRWFFGIWIHSWEKSSFEEPNPIVVRIQISGSISPLHILGIYPFSSLPLRQCILLFQFPFRFSPSLSFSLLTPSTYHILIFVARYPFPSSIRMCDRSPRHIPFL